MEGQDKSWVLPWDVHVWGWGCFRGQEAGSPGCWTSSGSFWSPSEGEIHLLPCFKGTDTRAGLLRPGCDRSTREGCTCLWGCKPQHWQLWLVRGLSPSQPVHAVVHGFGPGDGCGGTTGWGGGRSRSRLSRLVLPRQASGSVILGRHPGQGQTCAACSIPLPGCPRGGGAGWVGGCVGPWGPGSDVM